MGLRLMSAGGSAWEGRQPVPWSRAGMCQGAWFTYQPGPPLESGGRLVAGDIGFGYLGFPICEMGMMKHLIYSVVGAEN